MARRPDGSYEFGDYDLDNPAYQQREALREQEAKAARSRALWGGSIRSAPGSVKHATPYVAHAKLRSPGARGSDRAKTLRNPGRPIWLWVTIAFVAALCFGPKSLRLEVDRAFWTIVSSF